MLLNYSAKYRPKLQEIKMNLRTAFYISILIALICSVTQAQAQRTWVSGLGDDGNPCSRTAPCRTFAGAIAKTATGGEIDCLDPSGFGPVIISKSITIDGTRGLSGILATTLPNVITINLTTPNDAAKTVRLRGLSLNGLGTGTNGINVISDGSVSVEDCVIDGFAIGIKDDTAALFVRNTTIRNNRTAGIAAKGKVGLADVALVFNDTATQGSLIQLLGNVYLFGNRR